MKKSAWPKWPEKPKILYTTPRTGSTPINLILAAALKQKFNSKNFYELLTPSSGFHFEATNNFSFESFSDTQVWLNLNSEDNQRYLAYIKSLQEHPELEKSIELARFELVKKYPGNYFFKCFSGQIIPEQMKTLDIDGNILFLERESLWEQLLSFLISRLTNVYYSNQERRLQEASLEPTFEDYFTFENHIRLYYQVKAMFPDAPVVTYEKFSSHGPKQFLRELGFSEVTLDSLNLLPALNGPHKEKYFKNLSQIQEWYGTSALAIIDVKKIP